MRKSLALVLLAPALTACSSDPCADGASATQNVASYLGSCQSSNPAFFGGFSPCFDQNACETNLKSCTAADRAVLEAVVKCQNTYASSGACTEQATKTFETCGSAATTGVDGGSAFSPACAAAFSQNGGSCSADAG